MSDLTVVSLFDGIGGFLLAFQRAGAQLVASVEIDQAAAAVSKRHFPEVHQFEDVTKVSGDDLRSVGFVPERGIITAGWPCQDLSVAGRRAGLAGERSGLWWEVVRLLSETGSRWFLGENVPGLLSSNGGRDMGAVVGALGELGYGFAYRVLDAQWFGVPQRRRRVFFVGHLGEPFAAAAEVLFELEGGAGHFAAGGEEGQGVAAGSARGLGVASRSGGGLAPTLTARYRKGLGRIGDDPYVVEDGPDTHTHTQLRRCRAAGNAAGGSTPNQQQEITSSSWAVAALTSNGVGTCGADDNQAQAGHLIAETIGGGQVTHSLTSEGHDASEDGTGRGTPIAAITIRGGATGFHMTQDPISSEEQVPCIGSQSSGNGVMHQGDQALYSIMPMNSGKDYKARQVEVAQPPMTSPVGGNQGGDFVVTPLAIRGREHGAELEIGTEDPCGPPPVSVAENQRGEIREGDTAGAVTVGGGKPGQGYQAVREGTVVRRLTELECERLQGYPDNWTEGQTASARYRQLGNSVAVPCVEWIAHRLIAVDKDITA